jgi:hypothetical protein
VAAVLLQMEVVVLLALLVWLLVLPARLVWRLPLGPPALVMQQQVLQQMLQMVSRAPMQQPLQGWRVWALPGVWPRVQAPL